MDVILRVINRWLIGNRIGIEQPHDPNILTGHRRGDFVWVVPRAIVLELSLKSLEFLLVCYHRLIVLLVDFLLEDDDSVVNGSVFVIVDADSGYSMG